MPTLLQMTDDMLALDDLIDECEGDMQDPRIQDAVGNWLAELNENLEQKVDNYAAFIVELKARAEARKIESTRLANRSRTDSRAAVNLADRLKFALGELGIKKLETDRYKVSVAGNGGKQPLDVHGVVPDDFNKSIVSPDNEKIRAALDAGEELDFAILQDRGTRLSIR